MNKIKIRFDTELDKTDGHNYANDFFYYMSEHLQNKIKKVIQEHFNQRFQFKIECGKHWKNKENEQKLDDDSMFKSILGKISIYVRILQDGDPENENPKKILDTIEKELEPYEQQIQTEVSK